MKPKALPLSVIAALGLTTETACACLNMVACLKMESPDSGDTSTGACLDYSVDDTATGPCLTQVESGDSGDSATTGPCLDIPPDSGDSADSGKDTADSGDSGVRCLDAPMAATGPIRRPAFPGYTDAVQSVLAKGVLPQDVAERLRRKR